MATLLLVMAGYFVLDRLITIGQVGRKLEVTPGVAVLSTLTGTFFVIVLLLAAFRGVTP